MEEIWREIKNFPAYEISNFGRVRRVRKAKNGKVPGLLKGYVNEDGYRNISLSTGLASKTLLVHRLAAAAFFGESELQVNHLNGNKLDNGLENLEYATAQENTLHAIENKLRKPIKGESNFNAKLSLAQVAEIKTRLQNGEKQSALAADYGVSQVAISLIKRGVNWAGMEF